MLPHKEKFFTIPNILSLFRLSLIPLIVKFYHNEQTYYYAVLVILISSLSDILDGYIARKYNMISDIGKILDPFADKVTQFTIMICLSNRYSLLYIFLIIFVIKQTLLVLLGYIAIKKLNYVNYAKWYGKLNTVILTSSMAILILFPKLNISVANSLIILCCVASVTSFILYVQSYIQLFKENKEH